MKRSYMYLIVLSLIVLSACSVSKEVEVDCNSYAGSEKDDCFHKLALDTEARLLTICGNINDVTKQQNCLMDLVEKKTSPFDCNVFNEENYRDECYLYFGMGYKNVNYCDKVISIVSRDLCYSGISLNYDEARIYCDKISDESEKAKCKSNIGVN